MNLISLRIRILVFFVLFAIPSFSSVLQEIQLGALLPLSGAASSNGLAGKAAVELAVEDANAYFAREGLGYRVTLTVMDTETDPVKAVLAIKALSAKGIRAIIGPYASTCVAAVKEFADHNGILLLSPASSSVDLAVADHIYRLVPDDALQGLALAYYLQEVGVKMVIPVYMNDTFGISLFESTKATVQSLGLSYTGGISFDPSITDFGILVKSLRKMVDQAIEQTGSASLVAVHLIAFNQALDLFNAAADDNVLSSIPWVGNDGMAQNTQLLADPVAVSFAVKTKFVCPIFKHDDRVDKVLPTYPMMQQFQKKLQSKLRKSGDHFAANAYDAAFILALTYVNGSMPNDINSLEASFLDTIPFYIGYTMIASFNDAGDLFDGAYGFYTVTQDKSGQIRWKTTASFRFNDGKPDGPKPLTMGGFKLPSSISNFSISALLPLTGELRQIGESSKQALQIAGDDINFFLQAEGIEGGLQLHSIDVQTNAQTALNKMQELKSTETSRIVVGPYTSSSVDAVRKYAQDNNFILISPTSTLSSLVGLDDNVYSLMYDVNRESESLASFYQELNITAVIPVWRDDLYGNDLKTAFESMYTASGGTVFEGVSYEPNQTDYRDMIKSCG